MCRTVCWRLIYFDGIRADECTRIFSLFSFHALSFSAPFTISECSGLWQFGSQKIFLYNCNTPQILAESVSPNSTQNYKWMNHWLWILWFYVNVIHEFQRVLPSFRLSLQKYFYVLIICLCNTFGNHWNAGHYLKLESLYKNYACKLKNH